MPACASIRDGLVLATIRYANWYKGVVAIFHPYDSTYYAFAKKCTTSMKTKDHHGQEQSKDIFQKLNMLMSLFVKQAGWVLKSKILAKNQHTQRKPLCYVNPSNDREFFISKIL